MRIALKKLRPSAVIPARGTWLSAGYDLFADIGEAEVYEVLPHTTYKAKTGIAVAIPSGYFGAIFARSGIATKKGLRPANCVGVVDSDYRGELIVALHNDTNSTQYFRDGDRIAQLVIMPYESAEFDVVDDLDKTERGEGGFGSTDVTCRSNVDNNCFDCGGDVSQVLTGQLCFDDIIKEIDDGVTTSHTYCAPPYTSKN